MVNPSVSSRSFDFVGFGDEVPGILALVSAAREYRRRTGSPARSALLLKGNEKDGVGGHLVRGRLAYLDRSRVSDIPLPSFKQRKRRGGATVDHERLGSKTAASAQSIGQILAAMPESQRPLTIA